ncbi:hypothetical protein JCM10213_003183 [Rhodosporidiobolus nylandii]
MAFSQSRLHNPLVRLPAGPRTPTHLPVSLLPLTSARSAHITRLYTLLLHLLSLPPSPRVSGQAVRAWRALASCREVHLAVLWRVGGAVIDRLRSEGEGGEGEEDEEEQRERAGKRAEWLKFCQEGREERVDKFHEYCLALVAQGRVEFAVDELDAYLDNQPYRDSVALNTLYGLLALLLAQPPSSASGVNAPSSSSSGSSSDSDSDDERHTRRRKRQGGSPSKRAKVDVRDSDDDYAPLLLAMQQNAPSLFSKARERFRRAAHLEEREAKEAGFAAPLPGEAARWLALIRTHVEKIADREGSPA